MITTKIDCCTVIEGKRYLCEDCFNEFMALVEILIKKANAYDELMEGKDESKRPTNTLHVKLVKP